MLAERFDLSSSGARILALTVGRSHAQVEVLAADLDAHAAVLWEAALGDVQAAHDFQRDASANCICLGRRGDIQQRAIKRVTGRTIFSNGSM